MKRFKFNHLVLCSFIFVAVLSVPAGAEMVQLDNPVFVHAGSPAADITVESYSVPSVADFDGDGVLDLVVGEAINTPYVGKVRFYHNFGTADAPVYGGFVFAQTASGDLSVPRGGCLGIFPQLVDWDLDGDLDLLAGLGDGTVKIFLNVGTTTHPLFDAGANVTVGPASSKAILDVGDRATPVLFDWNNDGKRDLIVGALDGKVRLYINEGTDVSPDYLTMQLIRSGTADLMIAAGRSSPAVVDIDGDGRKDLISGETNGKLHCFLNVGTDAAPAFSGSIKLAAGGQVVNTGISSRSRPFVCDYNGDGRLDILVGAVDGKVHLFIGIPKYSGGTETGTDPYRISTIADWQQLMTSPADWNKSFILTADLDLSGITVTPIAPDTENSGSNGFQGIKFTGTFDGNGHVLSNLTIAGSPHEYIGVFGWLDLGGQIKNLGVENMTISGSNYVGGLVGYNNGTITSCYATGSASTLGSYVGCLVGYNRGTIISCYSTGTASGIDFVGGLAGANDGPMTACYTACAVSGSTYVGGLAGGHWNTLKDCFWDIQISGTTEGVGCGCPNPYPINEMGKTTSEMWTLSTFTGSAWDFVGESANGTADVWRMCVDNIGYPRLAWEFSQGGDFACPDGVHIEDLDFLIDRWMATTQETAGAADGNLDGKVGIEDFAILSNHWMLESIQTGSLAVTISPQGAIDAGAQWRRVGTDKWFNSGGIDSGIPVGSYSVEFNSVTGWNTPANQDVTIHYHRMTNASGPYTPHTGSLVVTISPQGAIDAGAQWRRVDTTPWFNSGDTESGITIGSYSVEFKPISGWDTPGNQDIAISNTQTTDAGGTYIQQTGSLAVTISPQGAIDAGAQWRRVDTTPWFNSGDTESGIAVGSYSVEFKSAEGWSVPAPENITVSPNLTTSISGHYTLVIPEGLIAHWLMDDNAADGTVADSGDNQLNGTARQNTSALTTAGKFGTALAFNGTTDWIDCGTSAALLPDAWTLSAWVRCDDLMTPMLISFGANYPSIKLQNTSDGKPRIHLGQSNYRYFAASAWTTLKDGQWHHVAFTVPGKAQADIGQAMMYVDGAAVNGDPAVMTSAQAAKTHVYLGANPAIGTQRFGGAMDEVMLFNRALTDGEIGRIAGQ